jgi:hypothetical protein
MALASSLAHQTRALTASQAATLSDDLRAVMREAGERSARAEARRPMRRDRRDAQYARGADLVSLFALS